MTPLEELSLELAENSLGILPAVERADATELIKMCRAFWGDSPENSLPDSQVEGPGAPGDPRRVQAGRLVELLARRSAKAMPYAALGRAYLADLHGAAKDKVSLLDEFQIKMSMLGL